MKRVTVYVQLGGTVIEASDDKPASQVAQAFADKVQAALREADIKISVLPVTWSS